MDNKTTPILEKIYLQDDIATICLEQGAKSIHKDVDGYYVIGFTHGVVALDLHNNDNCATTVYWK